MHAPEKLLLAAPRGYCAGVDRAVQTVERALELHGAPVYVRKEIVHNKHVVEKLRERGAIFVDELDDTIPEGAITVFSAHGVSPAVHAEAFLASLEDRPVGPPVDPDALRAALGQELTDAGVPAEQVIDELVAGADPGIVASAGPRYFGFVTGGAPIRPWPAASHPARLSTTSRATARQVTLAICAPVTSPTLAPDGSPSSESTQSSTTSSTTDAAGEPTHMWAFWSHAEASQSAASAAGSAPPVTNPK